MNAAKPAPRKTGRPSKYTEELAAEIAQRLSDGEPLRQICRDAHMPHWTNIYEWMARDQDLSVRIARAREAGYDKMAEECLEIADTPNFGEKRTEHEDGVSVTTEDMLGHRKLQIETRLKLLAKWNPKKYGDRVTMAGDAENPLQVKADVSIFDAMLKNLEAKRQLGDK
ncbi:MAG: terminase [Betaproteobacteria bacterium]|nr:terminase [Betaproteobacteria bacterium]